MPAEVDEETTNEEVTVEEVQEVIEEILSM
jgi:hypothetical protein